MTILYFCPHGHHIECSFAFCGDAPAVTVKNPAEIAHCAKCEHKEPMLLPTGRNRAEVVQTCTIYKS